MGELIESSTPVLTGLPSFMNDPTLPNIGDAPAASSLELVPLAVAASAQPLTTVQPPSIAPPLVPARPRSAAPSLEQRFEFTGTGTEYFKIWIVNLLLTIVTLGIYSAWAKVRRLRYFYNNTRFAGSNFDFHGSPIAILKGRIIAVILIAGLQVPVLNLVVLALYLLGLPWLLYRSLRFHMANTSYRNLRFAFLGTAKGAYAALFTPIAILIVAGVISGLTMWKFPIVGGIFAVMTVLAFYAIGPYLQYRMRRYYTEGAHAGSSPFSLHIGAGQYYVVYLVALGFMMALGAVAAVVLGFTVGLDMMTIAEGGKVPFDKVIVTGVLVAGIYITMLAVGPLVIAMLQNTIWRGTSLAGKRFKSEVPVAKFMLTWLVQTFLTVITLGLYRPFAVVKFAHMRIEAMVWTGSADSMIAVLREGIQKAGGAEVADLMNIDIAL